MDTKKFIWHKIAESKKELLWQENGLAIVEVAGKKITVGLFNSEIFACGYKCPHASGILADGFIDATGNIVCPIHRYKFSVRNGRNVTGEGYYLKVYAVEENEKGIYVGFEESSWEKIFK